MPVKIRADRSPGRASGRAQRAPSTGSPARGARDDARRLALAEDGGDLGFLEWDPRSGAATCTPGLERILGLAPGAFEGTLEAWSRRVHPGDRPRTLARLRRWARTAAARGERRDAPLVYRVVRGREERVVEARVTFTVGPGGRPRAASIHHDVTEARDVLRALRESELRYRSLVVNAPDVIARFDRELRHVYANPALEGAIGLPPARVLGRTAREIGLPTELAARWEAALRSVFETGDAVSLELVLDGPLGRRRYETRVAPEHALDGTLPTVLAIGRDVTERAAAERAARERDRRKNDFLAVLSHELRNPLAAIRNALWLLARTEPLGGREARARAIIERQSAQLTRLVDDLLDVTRVTRGKIRLQPERLDLAALLRRTAEDHRPAYAAQGLALRLDLPDGPAWTEGDPARLAQAFGNLLVNAARFTDGGGEVRVALAREAERLAVSVRDTGVGMTGPALARLFEPFAQADETLHRTGGGLGLGLSLVRALVELHGGDVSAASEGPGRGAEFTVRLPASGALPATAPRPRSRAAGPRGG
jgi:PAS domain S-box-containing protein